MHVKVYNSIFNKKKKSLSQIIFSIFIINHLQIIKIDTMSNYPLINFHYSVEWGGSKIGFSEVSGLSAEHELLEYRDGASPEFNTIKVPGMRKYSNIILKRGSYRGDNEFFEWFNTVQLSKIERRDITISLLNEAHEPIIIWKIKNSWPVALKFAELNAMKSEVLIESLKIAHEGFNVQTV